MFNGNGINNAPTGYSQPPSIQAPYGRQQPEPSIRLPPQVVAHIYKSSTNLFLTRRLSEALAVLQPVINDPSTSVRHCPRALRIKFWGLYLAILDAAAKTGAQEGKATWGAEEWPELVGKIKTGAVWDEVNRTYGDEGRVDADVVVTLATLLLTHCPDQSITQKKIEAYLGAAPSSLSMDEDPKTMLQRSRIIEIYVLHVLPRLGFWEYAREFAHLSPDIDEEQKEQFYQALESLQKAEEERDTEAARLATQRDLEEEERRNEERRSHKARSRPASTSSRTSRHRAGSVKPQPRTSSVKPTDRSSGSREEGAAVAIPAKVKKTTPAVVPRATGRTKPNTSLISSTTAVLSKMQMFVTTNSGPFSILQTIVMLAVIAWMTNNKKMRDRIRKFLILCWIKIARTVGMGMKVTYV